MDINQYKALLRMRSILRDQVIAPASHGSEWAIPGDLDELCGNLDAILVAEFDVLLEAYEHGLRYYFDDNILDDSEEMKGVDSLDYMVENFCELDLIEIITDYLILTDSLEEATPND